MQSRQTRTTKNNNTNQERLQKGTGFSSMNANARNTENGTTIEKETIQRFEL
jgi:hypothetical protein